MEIIEIKQRGAFEADKKAIKYIEVFVKLINELKKRELPDEVVIFINDNIDIVNKAEDNQFLKAIQKAQTAIINKIEKELKIVPRKYYQKFWKLIGMAAFGMPLGLLFGLSLGNMAFLGIGLPIGLAIGLALGSGMDKKAFEENRQLDVEIDF